MPRQLRVFLCHASQDKPVVWKLHRYLIQHGVQPWLDQNELLPGQSWQVEIPKAIDNSDVILVCLSKNSINKEGYVQKEIAFALDKALEKPEGTIFIIPVKLEECEVPKRLSSYQWVDYFRADGRKRLLMGLNMRAKSLGEEISSLIMEDSRQRASRTQPAKEDGLEEPKRVPLAQKPPVTPKIKSKGDKPVQAKPFTKILDPSALNPPKEKDNRPQKPGYRWVGIGGIVLLLIVLGSLGLNSLLNKPGGETLTPASQVFTETPKLLTDTKAPVTSTPEPTETVVPTPTLGIGSTMISEKDGMVMVYVPAGEFTMGSDNGDSDEKPIHQVYLDAFWIDQTEVTNAMFAAYLNNTKTSYDDNPWLDTSDENLRIFWDGEKWMVSEGYESHPIILINWLGAGTYCHSMGRILPTEAQWEKSARGVDERMYPWGEMVSCKYSNYLGCIGGTMPVSSYPDGASVYGALDMIGNVWELVSSLYQPYPYGATDGREDLSALSVRAVRGGSYVNSIFQSRSTEREWVGLLDTNKNIGFRCAMDATP